MVVIDSTFLLPMVRPGVLVPVGPDGAAVDRAQERMDFLVKGLERDGTKIIIPTPVLSEALVRAGAAGSQEIVERLNRSSMFRIEPFDTRAAIELAAMTRDALDRGRKRGVSQDTWAKVKFDRQIVAIAKVCGATIIYSDDSGVKAFGEQTRIRVIRISELPLPPQDPQHTMDFSDVAAGPANEAAAEMLAGGRETDK
jgi:hypothetical protein